MTDSAAKNGFAYYKNRAGQGEIEFPLRRGPIRFAVMRKYGALSSNSWRVWVTDEGSAYVRCRDHMKEMKASLHGSGDHRIAFTNESGLEMTGGSRLWTGWSRPLYDDGSKVVPSLRLFFPSWALTLTREMRKANPKMWNGNEFFIEAAETPQATILSFVITADDLTIRFRANGDQPSLPIGVLPIKSGQKLWVIEERVPELNMRELALQGLKGVPSDSGTAQKLNQFSDGHVLGLCVVGQTLDAGRYWMPYSVKVNRDHNSSSVPR